MSKCKFYGKYRGKVTDNIDPQEQGRIEVNVPAVLNMPSWAMPCVPYAGPQVGFVMLPPIEANVWVEFEGGNPNYPIWSGCFWGEGELPVAADSPNIKLIKMESISLTIDDDAGSISLANVEETFSVILTAESMTFSLDPALLSLTPDNIEISLGEASIALTPATVSINEDALVVT